MVFQFLHMPRVSAADWHPADDVLKGPSKYLVLIGFAAWSVWTMFGCPGL